MQIKDRVFIVTGASSGIGLSTAITLSEQGGKVALLARSTDALQELSRKLPGSLPVTVDMTQFDRVKEAIGAVHKHYGRIDGLVNNAGRSYAASVEEIDPIMFDEICHLNVLGPIVAMQAVIPVMRAQGGGSIVNINSGTAFMTAPQYSVYSSSKQRAAWLQPHGARRAGKGPHRRQRNLSLHHGDELRKEPDGKSGRRRPGIQLRRGRQARVRGGPCAASHRGRTGAVFRE
jgi:NADP-dependent 3-hydroxy acid dehydrogenase YdfG